MSYGHVITSHPMNCVSNIEHAIFLLKGRSRFLHFATILGTLIINREEGKEHNRKCREKDKRMGVVPTVKCAEYYSGENGGNVYIFLIHIKINLGILRLDFVG
jgi:hypothetical protein